MILEDFAYSEVKARQGRGLNFFHGLDLALLVPA